MSGKLIGIALRAVSRAPMELRDWGEVTLAAGLVGDCKGSKFPQRQITILSIEDWHSALFDLGSPDLPPDLPWTTRRANLLVKDVKLPRGAGSLITIGTVHLEVTQKTSPCALMDHFYPGLRLALAPEWRGGVTCRVLHGGEIHIGDGVTVTKEIREKLVQLPG